MNSLDSCYILRWVVSWRKGMTEEVLCISWSKKSKWECKVTLASRGRGEMMIKQIYDSHLHAVTQRKGQIWPKTHMHGPDYFSSRGSISFLFITDLNTPMLSRHRWLSSKIWFELKPSDFENIFFYILLVKTLPQLLIYVRASLSDSGCRWDLCPPTPCGQCSSIRPWVFPELSSRAAPIYHHPRAPVGVQSTEVFIAGVPCLPSPAIFSTTSGFLTSLLLYLSISSSRPFLRPESNLSFLKTKIICVNKIGTSFVLCAQHA